MRMINLKDKIKVTIAQFSDQSIDKCSITYNSNFESQFEPENKIKYNYPKKQLEKFFKALNVASKENADFLIFPELFMPSDYVNKYVSTSSQKHSIIIIGGMEWNHHQTINGKKYIRNQGFISLPIVNDNSSQNYYTKAHVLFFSKLYPAPTEMEYLSKNGYYFENGNKVFLFSSKKFGNWAILICIDYLNLPIQVLLQGKIQTLFVIAYNKDVEYYYSLSDSLHRILLCNIVVCNTGVFGGSHAYTPLRKKHLRNVFQTRGNDVNTAVTIELPIKQLKEEQKCKKQYSNSLFIKKSPDYGFLSGKRIKYE